MAKKLNAKKKFWAFKALAYNEGELTIYGEIVDSQGGSSASVFLIHTPGPDAAKKSLNSVASEWVRDILQGFTA